MAKKKTKPEFDYAATFDRLMEEKFNMKFETDFDIFFGTFGGYRTRRVDGKKLTMKMATYGSGISDGIAAGREQAI